MLWRDCAQVRGSAQGAVLKGEDILLMSLFIFIDNNLSRFRPRTADLFPGTSAPRCPRQNAAMGNNDRSEVLLLLLRASWKNLIWASTWNRAAAFFLINIHCFNWIKFGGRRTFQPLLRIFLFYSLFWLRLGARPPLFSYPWFTIYCEKNTLRRPQFPKNPSNKFSFSFFFSLIFLFLCLRDILLFLIAKQTTKIYSSASRGWKRRDFFKLIENIFESIRPRIRDEWDKIFLKSSKLCDISGKYIPLVTAKPSLSQVKGRHFY